MSKLLPCPFCGGKACVETRSSSTAIRCSNDQCVIGDPAPFNDFTHRTDAITAWNTRPVASELLAQLEYAVKLFGAWPMLNGTAQVQSMRETIAQAPTPLLSGSIER